MRKLTQLSLTCIILALPLVACRQTPTTPPDVTEASVT
jgi:hypothetical protein